MKPILIDDVDTSDYVYGFNDGYKAKEEENKYYRWHKYDKKDIFNKDLPNKDTIVEVMFENGNFNHAIYDRRDDCWCFKNVSKIDLKSSVCRWRYIEKPKIDI